MGFLVLTDAVVVINSVDLSDHVSKVAIPFEAEQLDTTAMGATWKASIAGLKSGELGLTFKQDFAAAKVDATLWAAFGTVVPFSVKATSAANSATNPQYSGSILVNQYAPLDGEVGSLAEVNVGWPTSGAVSRATS